MKIACALAIALSLCAAPTLSPAAGFSWSSPFGTGNVASDDLTQSGSASGSGEYGAVPFSWSFSWDVPSQTVGVDAAYGDDSYGFSASWANIFAALFGL